MVYATVMEKSGDAQIFHTTRSTVLTAIQDLVAKVDDPTNRRLLQYLTMYLTLKPDSSVGGKDLLTVLQGVSTKGQSTEEELQGKPQATSSGRYSQVYHLSTTPDAHRKKMIVTELSSDTTEQTLVEYFRRYGIVTDVKMYDTVDTKVNQGPAFAVLEFCNPISVQKAVRMSHVVDRKAVTCLPYQADRMVEAIPWTSSSMVEKARDGR